MAYFKNAANSLLNKTAGKLFQEYADSYFSEESKNSAQSLKDTWEEAKGHFKEMRSNFAGISPTLRAFKRQITTGSFGTTKEEQEKYEAKAMGMDFDESAFSFDDMEGGGDSFSFEGGDTNNEFNFDEGDKYETTNNYNTVNVINNDTSSKFDRELSTSDRLMNDKMDVQTSVFASSLAGASNYLAEIAQHLNEMKSFNSDATTNFYTTSLEYFQAETSRHETLNKYYELSLERLQEETKEAKKRKETYDTMYKSINMISHSVDVIQNFAGMLSLLPMAVNPVLQRLGTDPLGLLVEKGGTWLFKKMFSKPMRVWERFQLGIHERIGNILNNWSHTTEKGLFGTITKWLGNTFKPDMEGRDSLSLGVKKKEAKADFDNETHNSINTVIPMYLSKILQAVSKTDDMQIYDVQSGRMVSSIDIEDKIQKKVDEIASGMDSDLIGGKLDTYLSSSLDPELKKRIIETAVYQSRSHNMFKYNSIRDVFKHDSDMLKVIDEVLEENKHSSKDIEGELLESFRTTMMQSEKKMENLSHEIRTNSSHSMVAANMQSKKLTGVGNDMTSGLGFNEDESATYKQGIGSAYDRLKGDYYDKSKRGARLEETKKEEEKKDPTSNTLDLGDSENVLNGHDYNSIRINLDGSLSKRQSAKAKAALEALISEKGSEEAAIAWLTEQRKAADRTDIEEAHATGQAYDNGKKLVSDPNLVSEPTIASLAGTSGKKVLIGESGPEAIMPLERGADGSLGVKIASVETEQTKKKRERKKKVSDSKKASEYLDDFNQKVENKINGFFNSLNDLPKTDLSKNKYVKKMGFVEDILNAKKGEKGKALKGMIMDKLDKNIFNPLKRTFIGEKNLDDKTTKDISFLKIALVKLENIILKPIKKLLVGEKKAKHMTVWDIVKEKFEKYISLPIRKLIVGKEKAKKMTLWESLETGFEKHILLPTKRLLLGDEKKKDANKKTLWEAISYGFSNRLLLPLKKEMLGEGTTDKKAKNTSLYKAFETYYVRDILNPFKGYLLGTKDLKKIKKNSLIESMWFRYEESILTPMKQWMMGGKVSRKKAKEASFFEEAFNALDKKILTPFKNNLFGKDLKGSKATVGAFLNRLLFGNQRASRTSLWDNIKKEAKTIFKDVTKGFLNDWFKPFKNAAKDYIKFFGTTFLSTAKNELKMQWRNFKKFATPKLKKLGLDIGEILKKQFETGILAPLGKFFGKLNDRMSNLWKMVLRAPLNFMKGLADQRRAKHIEAGLSYGKKEDERIKAKAEAVKNGGSWFDWKDYGKEKENQLKDTSQDGGLFSDIFGNDPKGKVAQVITKTQQAMASGAEKLKETAETVKEKTVETFKDTSEFIKQSTEAVKEVAKRTREEKSANKVNANTADKVNINTETDPSKADTSANVKAKVNGNSIKVENNTQPKEQSVDSNTSSNEGPSIKEKASLLGNIDLNVAKILAAIENLDFSGGDGKNVKRKGFFGRPFGRITGFFGTLFSPVISAVKDGYGLMKSIVKSTGSAIKFVTKDLWNTSMKLISGIVPLVKGISSGIGSVVKGIGTAIGGITKAIGGVLSTSITAIESIFNKTINIAGKAFLKVAKGIGATIGAIGSVIGEIGPKLVKGIGVIGESLLEATSSLIKGVGKLTTSTIKTLAEVGTTIIDGIGSLAKSFINNFLPSGMKKPDDVRIVNLKDLLTESKLTPLFTKEKETQQRRRMVNFKPIEEAPKVEVKEKDVKKKGGLLGFLAMAVTGFFAWVKTKAVSFAAKLWRNFALMRAASIAGAGRGMTTGGVVPGGTVPTKPKPSMGGKLASLGKGLLRKAGWIGGAYMLLDNLGRIGNGLEDTPEIIAQRKERENEIALSKFGTTADKLTAKQQKAVTDERLSGKVVSAVGSGASDALSGAMIGATIGSVVPVVGTAVGGLIGGVVGFLSGFFAETGSETGDVLSLIGSKLAEWAGAAWEGIKDIGKGIFNFFAKVPKMLWDGVKSTAEGIGKLIGGIADWVGEKFRDGIDVMGSKLKEGWNTFVENLLDMPKKILSGMVGNVTEYISNMKASIIETTSNIQTNITTAAGKAWNFVKNITGNMTDEEYAEANKKLDNVSSEEKAQAALQKQSTIDEGLKKADERRQSVSEIADKISGGLKDITTFENTTSRLDRQRLMIAKLEEELQGDRDKMFEQFSKQMAEDKDYDIKLAQRDFDRLSKERQELKAANKQLPEQAIQARESMKKVSMNGFKEGDTNQLYQRLPLPKNQDWSSYDKMSVKERYAHLAPTILSAASAIGLDPALALGTIWVESKFHPTIKAKGSNAKGLYQFVPDTWTEQLQKYGNKFGIPSTALNTDVRASAILGAKFVKDNADRVRKIKEPTTTDMYLYHFAGSGGGAYYLKGLRSTPNARVDSNNPSKDIRAQWASNIPIFYNKDGSLRTYAEMYQELNRRVADGNKFAQESGGFEVKETTMEVMNNGSESSLDISNDPTISREGSSGFDINSFMKKAFNRLIGVNDGDLEGTPANPYHSSEQQSFDVLQQNEITSQVEQQEQVYAEMKDSMEKTTKAVQQATAPATKSGTPTNSADNKWKVGANSHQKGILRGAAGVNSKYEAKFHKTQGKGVLTTDFTADAMSGYDPNKEYFRVSGEEGRLNVTGMDPKVLDNYNKMAYHYKVQTGKTLVMNTGYRSLKMQQKLWDKALSGKGNKAARPGTSLHGFGVAIDMDSSINEQLERSGLMKKYGFYRPLPVKGETQHIQAMGIRDVEGLAKYAAVGDTGVDPQGQAEMKEAKAFNGGLTGGGGAGGEWNDPNIQREGDSGSNIEQVLLKQMEKTLGGADAKSFYGMFGNNGRSEYADISGKSPLASSSDSISDTTKEIANNENNSGSLKDYQKGVDSEMLKVHMKTGEQEQAQRVKEAISGEAKQDVAKNNIEVNPEVNITNDNKELVSGQSEQTTVLNEMLKALNNLPDNIRQVLSESISKPQAVTPYSNTTQNDFFSQSNTITPPNPYIMASGNHSTLLEPSAGARRVAKGGTYLN